MKKSYLMIAAAATLLTACMDNDAFRRDINESNEQGGAIGFTSFTDKVTKSTAENSEALYTWTFYDHQESFQVWARKANQPDEEIFDGTKVTVTREGSAEPYIYKYTYDPARFWDKNAAKYHFYAAAPAQPDGNTPAWTWTFNAGGITDNLTLDKGYFTTTSVLNGVNLQSITNGGPTTALKNVFKTATLADRVTKDIDKMIAAPCEVEKTYYNKSNPDAVNLNFIHILSKLNVTISTSLEQTPAGHDYDVKILGFEVKDIHNDGSFDESTAGFTAHGKNIRWSGYSTTTDIQTGIDNNTNKKTVPLTTGNKLYIVESLIIPQDIEYERIALDALHHDAIDTDPVPFTSYAAYEAARHNDVDRLTEAQFNALFATAYTTFKTWNAYTQVAIESIDETTFNARVAEASEAANDPYDTFADYTTAKGANATLNADQFAALIDNGAFRTWGTYVQVSENIDEDEFDARVKDATDVPAIDIAEYDVPTKPYFTITYSIDNEVFTANYNLAAAFLNYNNNGQKIEKDGNGKLVLTALTNADPTTFGFYEGWQNTLNIIINPAAITFTADVAEWSSTNEVEYEIENGNE